MADVIAGLVEEGALLESLERVKQSRMAHSLVVSDGISERVFYFAVGGLRLIRSGPRSSATLGEFLQEDGLLPEAEYGELLSMVDDSDSKALQVALDQGVVTADEYMHALKRKLEEDILDLFIWEGAEVRLVEGQPSEEFYSRGHQSASLSYDVAAFIAGCLVQLDALSGGLRRLSTGKEIYEVTDHVLAAQTDLGKYKAVLDHLDGRCTLSSAIEAAGVRRVPCHRLVQRLLHEGLVRRVAGSAAQKASREHYLKEAAALEDALKVSLAQHIVRARLARALENAGEKARAAQTWKDLADADRRGNDLEKALTNYRKCVRLLPTDFATRELILEIHRHQKNYRQLVSEGRPLADDFLKNNLLGRAKNLLLQLVGYEESDPQLRRQLITVLIGLGEVDLALEHLWALAAILEERGASEQALRDVYLRILALDRGNKRAQTRLDEVTGVASQRRALWGVAGSTMLLLLGLVGLFGYETYARGSVQAAIDEARQYLAVGDYENARDILRQATARFSFSKATDNASHMVGLIDELEAELIRRQQLAQGLGDRGISPEDKVAAEEMAYRALTLIEKDTTGSIEEGHRVFSDLFELYPWSETLEQANLPLKLTVLPKDAAVRLNGSEAGQGSFVVYYSPLAKSKLTVERDGFEPFEKILDGVQDFELFVSLQKPVQWEFQSNAAFDAAPLVDDDGIYLSGRDRFLTALSSNDGQPRWRVPLGLYSDVAITPIRTDAGIIAATALGDGFCVAPVTGETIWRRSLGVGVERQPVSTRAGAVVFPGSDGSLMSVQAASGEQEWVLPPGSVKSGGPIVLTGGRLAFIDQAGSLGLASPTDGALGNSQAGPAALTGTPIFDGERIWAWAGDSTIRAFSGDSTLPLKRFPVPRSSGIEPTSIGNRAWVLAGDGRVVGISAAGAMLFPPVALTEEPSAPAAYSHDRLYVPGVQGGLFVLDANTGELLWRFDAGARITAQPVVRDGVIYVVNELGTLFAVTE